MFNGNPGAQQAKCTLFEMLQNKLISSINILQEVKKESGGGTSRFVGGKSLTLYGFYLGSQIMGPLGNLNIDPDI